jgi:hypothetical protein
MIVGDLDAIGTAILPDETDAPLVVDPDAMLAGSVPLQGFQMIARRRGQVAQLFSLMDLAQFALSNPLDVRRKFPGKLSMEKPFRILVEEAPNHLSTMNVSRSERNAYIRVAVQAFLSKVFPISPQSAVAAASKEAEKC